MPSIPDIPSYGSGYEFTQTEEREGILVEEMALPSQEKRWKPYADIAGAIALAGMNRLVDEIHKAKERVMNWGQGGN